MGLELRHLRLVRAIADQGTMTQAAVVLHLSQSALSHQLREIEAALAARLFHRAGRRMILTPAGERLLVTSRRVLRDVETVESEIGGPSAGQRGTLRLSTQCITAYHWLPSRIGLLKQQLPDVDVDIRVEATADPVRFLLRGQLDLAVVHSHSANDGLEEFPLFSDEVVALVHPKSPLARKTFLTARDFAGSIVLMYPVAEETTLLFQRMLLPAGIEPAKVLKIQLTAAILEMARENLGIGILPRWSAQPAIARRELRAVRLSEKGLHRHWKALIPRHEQTPGYVRAFIDILARHPISLDGKNPNLGSDLKAVGRA
jgi:LysR family transcriptional regulator for metE and metH